MSESFLQVALLSVLAGLVVWQVAKYVFHWLRRRRERAYLAWLKTQPPPDCMGCGIGTPYPLPEEPDNPLCFSCTFSLVPPKMRAP